MVELTGLNGDLLELSPPLLKVTILDIDHRLSQKFIGLDEVIVHDLNGEVAGSR